MRARPRFAGRRIRRRDAGSRGNGLARPSPYLSTLQFPWLRRHPPPLPRAEPGSGHGPGTEGGGGGVRRGAPGPGGGGRASFPSPGARGGAPPVPPPGQLCHFCNPGPPPPALARTPGLFPSGPGAGAPERSAAPGPAGRRGGGARRRQSC